MRHIFTFVRLTAQRVHQPREPCKTRAKNDFFEKSMLACNFATTDSLESCAYSGKRVRNNIISFSSVQTVTLHFREAGAQRCQSLYCFT